MQETILLPKELPMTSEELDSFLQEVIKAEIIRPLKVDPIARKNGEILAIWVTV